MIEKMILHSNLPVFEWTGGAFEHRLFLHENEKWSSKGPKNIGNTKVTEESEHKHSGNENQLALTSLDRGLKIQWAHLIHQESLFCPPLLAAFLIPVVRAGFFCFSVISLLHAFQFSIFSSKTPHRASSFHMLVRDGLSRTPRCISESLIVCFPDFVSFSDSNFHSRSFFLTL
jgi:hypothetical protein